MLRLRRHRSLLVVIAVGLALGGVLVPALGVAGGHCVDPSDPHCSAKLAAVEPMPEPTPQEILQEPEPSAALPLLALALLKVPLAA